MNLEKAIRDVSDFPKKGIIFKDITPLLKDAELFRQAIDEMAEYYKNKNIDMVVCVESRGFIFGAALAYALGKGFVPVRKKGKLPSKTVSVSYELEYGTDTLEMHSDAVSKGDRVVLVDDLLATGGTISAVKTMLEDMGADIVGVSFLIELGFLNGRDKLEGVDIFSLIKY